MAEWWGTEEQIRLAKALRPRILQMYDEVLTYTRLALEHDGNQEGLQVIHELRRYVDEEIRPSTYTGAWIHQRGAVKSPVSAARILLFYYVEIIHEGKEMDGQVIKERKKRIALIQDRMREVARFLKDAKERGIVVDEAYFKAMLQKKMV